MPEVAEIFKSHGKEYLDKFQEKMLPSHKRALRDIVRCRTEYFGAHIYRCDHCGAVQLLYHSCRNRSCPKCHAKETKRWIEERMDELLPVKYFHVVFTLPEELREIVRSNQVVLLSLLMTMAALSLQELALDPKYVGGRIAILAVLHTWTRAMIYHPHVHCLIPAGGISKDGTTWLPSNPGFLVPVKALSIIFRAKFMAKAREAFPNIDFPQSLFKKEWVVYCKPAVQGSKKVLEYLARYVHRIAITNSRILSVKDGMVTFRYKDHKKLQR